MNLFNNDKLKEELDIYKSYKDTTLELQDEVLDTFEQCCKLINNSIYPNFIINNIVDYYKTGILSPLKLTDDEFISTGEGKETNKRYDNLIKENGRIICNKAWDIDIKHIYNKETNSEEEVFPLYITLNQPNITIYLTHGGCSIGKRIINPKLKQDIVDRHCYWPNNIINIPVSIIIYEDKTFICCCDEREPKLKLIKNMYDVDIVDTDVKFDIRKFKKLNKNGNSKR